MSCKFPFDFFTGFLKKPEPKLNWGIIIPHTLKQKGASGLTPYGSRVYEYDYAVKMASYLRHIPSETRNTKRIYDAAKFLVDNKEVTASIEPHLNAHDGTVEGFEILVLKDDHKSKKAALKIMDHFKMTFPSKRIRALREIRKDDNGFGNLTSAKAAGIEVALLTEAFFIDNPKDWINPETMSVFWESALS